MTEYEWQDLRKIAQIEHQSAHRMAPPSGSRKSYGKPPTNFAVIWMLLSTSTLFSVSSFWNTYSDAFEEIHAEIAKEKGADPEDRDEYISRNIFWVPKEARWEEFQTKAKLKEIKLPDGKKGDIGGLIDAGMIAIEKENPSLKGVLPKDYARPSLDKTRLGELIESSAESGLVIKIVVLKILSVGFMNIF